MYISPPGLGTKSNLPRTIHGHNIETSHVLLLISSNAIPDDPTEELIRFGFEAVSILEF